MNDERGRQRKDAFWDCYPDLEIDARQFVVEECSRKEATFTAEALAKFVDERFYQLNILQKLGSGLIRSVQCCRLDLHRFGAKYTGNSSRPYFLGHEREDVVKHREKFVRYFLQQKDHFYTITDDASAQWKNPQPRPAILFCS